jgi:hypothetical protein
MDNLLLLYDTREKDLARDFKDLLTELDLDICMIPLSPDLGKTLQAKEAHYFDSVDGVIFLITPGAERKGTLFPSPSVADEMGQAKQKFKQRPEKVVYLVDRKCNVQAVDQKSYIQFDRGDMRSVLESITLLLRNLKSSGGLRTSKVVERRETPGVEIDNYAQTIDSELKEICIDLSDLPNGFVGLLDFDHMLKNKYKKGIRDINFIKRDLQTKGLVTYHQPKPPNFYGGWQLSNIGFELVRYEIKKTNEASASTWRALLEQVSKGGGLLGNK